MNATQQQRIQLVQEWEQEFKTKYGGEFSDSAANIPIVLGVIDNQLQGVLSKENLTIATLASINLISWKVRPRDVGAEERKKAEAEADRNKRKLESIKRQQAGFQPKVRTELDDTPEQRNSQYDEARQKTQTDSNRRCQAEADRIIATHLVVTNGRVNHSRSNEQKAKLQNVWEKGINGQKDWRPALNALEAEARRLAGN